MATKYLGPSPKLRATDQNGTPLNGGFVYAYEAGTTTPITTYSNAAGTANAWPITLDSRGECSLYLTPGIKCDLKVTDANGVLQYTQTRESAPVTPSSYFAGLMVATTPSSLFTTIVAPSGTFTGDLDFEAAFNYAVPVTVGAASTTIIGAAASNCLTIDPAASALLHFDGSNGASTTEDFYGNTVTLTSATLSTTYPKFGASGLNATNSAARAEITGLTTLGASGWTLECWAYWTSLPNPGCIFSALNSSGYGLQLYTLNSSGRKLDPDLSSNGTSFDLAIPTSAALTMNTGTQYHIAITRDNTAGAYYVYFDGVLATSLVTASQICPIEKIRVGNDRDNVRSAQGYIDEFRFSAVCRYPGGITFTPSTTAFTS